MQMTIKPLKGFKSLETHHCVTGSMRHIYVYNDHRISEEMLLGIGSGMGFIYWHMKGTDPFLGGRRKGRPGDGFEKCVGQRTGVKINEYTTSSARKAEQTLTEMLDAGQPVMLQVDMGYLPYFDFGGYDYHFGAHMVVACGHDPATRQVLIADRDKELYPVALDDLAKARGSKHQPFSPKHRWYTFDFSRKRQPTAAEVRQAIAEQTREMLHPPITNIGVSGIRKAAARVLKWPQVMDKESLRRTLFNTFIFIDATGGSGGGLFRYMFSRFLREASTITGDERLRASAGEFHRIGDKWQQIALAFKQGWDTPEPTAAIQAAHPLLVEVADWEETAWLQLEKVT